MSLVQQLKDLRDQLARQEGVEPYFVLHLKTIEEIARLRPVTIDALAQIKGMGPKKVARYGAAILSAITSGHQPPLLATPAQAAAVLTVGEYLRRLNATLAGLSARIRGEVGRVETRAHGCYFDLKDASGESVLSCLVFATRYQQMGVALQEGMEIIVSGSPAIYARTGRLSLRVETIELAGEGRLRQAYEALRRRLTDDGLFAAERKRPIPQFARRVGIITSAHGDAIHDFTANLEPVGLKLELLDCRVEGSRAVPELVAAIAAFNRRATVEVLVVIRGGGSWESLQAFNNEAVCRAIANSQTPTLVGVGHERDVPLAALTADHFVSTPTAAAVHLSQPWRDARRTVREATLWLRQTLPQAAAKRRLELASATAAINRSLATLGHRQRLYLQVSAERLTSSWQQRLAAWPPLYAQIRAKVASAVRSVFQLRLDLRTQARLTQSGAARITADARRLIAHDIRLLQARSPKRLLHLGYSLVQHRGRLVRSAKQLRPNDSVTLRFGEGGAESNITTLIP